MNQRRGRATSLAASPLIVGAITTLIIIVAVFLAYNANNGLPFVSTYKVNVELPNASRLSPNNEVRIGGNRVGVVESIDTVQDNDSGQTYSKLSLKLDETANPIPEDPTLRVRYRSSFGLKYLELDRGASDQGIAEGDTLGCDGSASCLAGLDHGEEQTEFDDVGDTFD